MKILFSGGRIKACVTGRITYSFVALAWRSLSFKWTPRPGDSDCRRALKLTRLPLPSWNGVWRFQLMKTKRDVLVLPSRNSIDLELERKCTQSRRESALAWFNANSRVITSRFIATIATASPLPLSEQFIFQTQTDNGIIFFSLYFAEKTLKWNFLHN